MAEGASAVLVDSLWAATLQGTSLAWAAVYLQLHIGAPGAAGTSNIAVNSTRINVTGCFGTSSSGGAITNDDTIGPSVSVPASEDYTHFTLWPASTGTTGGFISGQVVSDPVTIGDDWDAPAGTLTVSGAVAA